MLTHCSTSGVAGRHTPAAAAVRRCSSSLLAAPPCCKSASHTSRHVRTVFAAAASAADGAVEDGQQQQQQQRQPKQQKYTQQRARQLARSVSDPNTPNVGIVSLTGKSQVAGAAACVAADLKTAPRTRVVPCEERLTQLAVNTVRMANRMLNQNLAADAAAPGGQPHLQQTLVFQPVEITGDLAAPPALPLGANVLYTSRLPAGHPVLRKVLQQRAAAAAQDADSLSGSSKHQFNITSKHTDYARVASSLNFHLTNRGWVELACLGRQDMVLPVAIQALVKLRRIRYGVHKDDAAAVLLGDEEALGPDGYSLPPPQEGMLPPTSLLLLRCAKNNPTRLLPLPVAPEA